MNIQSDDPSPADLTSRDADDRQGIGAGTSQKPNTDGSEEAIRQNLQELRQFTDEQTEKAKTAVSDAAEDKKNLAARQLDGIASAFEKIGAELDDRTNRPSADTPSKLAVPFRISRTTWRVVILGKSREWLKTSGGGSRLPFSASRRLPA